jgi:Ribonuclease G/E
MLVLFYCRVPLHNGGSLVIEQTEALVSIDVNGGHSMFGQGTSQEKAILEVNLEAAKQVCPMFCFVLESSIFAFKPYFSLLI